MGKIIGIDLGTTNSCVAIMEGREPKVIVNEEGSRITPSVVAWDDKGEVLVGQIAKRQAVTNPENTIYSAKRFIGRRFEEVTEETKRMPYKTVRAQNGDTAFDIRGKVVSPQEVSAKILQEPGLAYGDVSKPNFDDMTEDQLKKQDDSMKKERKKVQYWVGGVLSGGIPALFALVGVVLWRRRISRRANISLA